jgi:hypothetical protein
VPLNNLKKLIKSSLLQIPELLRLQEKQLILQAKMYADENRKLSHIQNLCEVEFSVYSQWGEDGIIDWLVSQIPEIPNTFVEFGVENYRESNTRLLLMLHNWRGLIMDGSENNIRDICSQRIYWKHELTAKHAFINAENINTLIKEEGMSDDIGLLSIDIDGNDYWIWKAIHVVNPAIVIIEYNAVFGDIHMLTVPYCPEFRRQEAHYSNLYFGASLPALIELGNSKGYQFVGTNSAGSNAFFIRKELMTHLGTSIKNFVAHNSLLRESRDRKGNLTFLEGKIRKNAIQNLKLVDLKTDKLVTLDELGETNTTLWDVEKKDCFINRASQ